MGNQLNSSGEMLILMVYSFHQAFTLFSLMAFGKLITFRTHEPEQFGLAQRVLAPGK